MMDDPQARIVWGSNYFKSVKIYNMNTQPKNPLHGITLKNIVESLVEEFGFEELGKNIPIKCFTTKPSINSSLVFLRKTPWARAKVENFYLWKKRLAARAAKKN